MADDHAPLTKTGKVLSIDKRPVTDTGTQPLSDECLGWLRDILRRAEAGEFVSVAFTGVHADNGWTVAHHIGQNGSTLMLVGAVRDLEFSIHHRTEH